MRGDGLGDLVADAVHRVEARERILEDHRDVLAADLLQLVGGSASSSRPLNRISPVITRALAVEQAHDREVRDALAGAGLADDPERLATLERERDVGDRLDDAVGRREPDREPANVEQRVAVLTSSERADR